MKHIIGIDFGTSTTMIKTREFDSANDNNLECRSITFTQNSIASCPTLIRKLGDIVWYGHEAEQNAVADSVLHSNFKLLLKSTDSADTQKAADLINEFFRYLYSCYFDQKGFVFKQEAPEETRVSYPAQWGETQRHIMTEAAKKAGFPNVVGVDEATAAVNCVLRTKREMLESKGYLKYGRTLNILIIDMGAGTTDLAFAETSVGAGGLTTRIKGIWPDGGSRHIFGGSIIDAKLGNMLTRWLTDSGLPETQAMKMTDQQRFAIKQWKENTVSALLKSDRPVDKFLPMVNLLSFMGMSPAPFAPIDRAGFETMMKDELTEFVNIINTAPKELRDETELVILTGGNSVWYWIDEIISGRNDRFGSVGLKNISGDISRILRMNDIQGGGGPADTVSKGLVLGSEMKIAMPEPEPEPAPAPRREETPAQTPAPAQRQEQPEVTSDFKRDAWKSSGAGGKFLLEYDPTSLLRPVIAVTPTSIFAVKSDGTVKPFFAFPSTKKAYQTISEVLKWRHIVSVAVTDDCVVGLKNDGTIIRSDPKIDLSNQSWNDIVSISAIDYNLYGDFGHRRCIYCVQSNGKVLIASEKNSKKYDITNEISSQTEIIRVKPLDDEVFLLKKNGAIESVSVKTHKTTASYSPQPIVDFGRGYFLLKNGTVKIEESQFNFTAHNFERVEKWKNIKYVWREKLQYANTKGYCDAIFGLNSNGTIISEPENLADIFQDWNNIIAISYPYEHNFNNLTIGLNKNGKLECTSDEYASRIKDWQLF